MAIRIKVIQTGTATIASGTTNITASIDEIVGDKTFLRFTYRTDTTDVGNGAVMGDFDSDFALKFVIDATAASSGVIIEWQVVEYTSSSNITIEEIIKLSVGDGDTSTIATVVINETYLINSFANTGSLWSGDDFAFSEITGIEEITYRLLTGGISKITSYVITSSDISTQLVSTLNSTSTTPTTSIAIIVENRSFCSGFTKLDTSTGDHENLCRLEFASPTSVKRTRNATRQQDFHTYVIKMPSDWTTSFGTGTISGGDTTDSITVSLTDTAKAFIQPGSGENLPSGNTDTTSELGLAFATFDLTSTTNIDLIRLSAGTTEDSVYTAWVVEDTEGVAGGSLLLMNRSIANFGGMR